ncbi:MAG TPA: hypothetical protein VKS78_19555 [Roseiarcus sp.]|nr:hypothetical protein [Roseiarcus sp.]
MADNDGDERRLDPEAAAAPNRDRRGEPLIIEGEAASQEGASEAAGSAAEAARSDRIPGEDAAQKPSVSYEPPAPRRGPQLFAAGLGGLAGAIIAAAILWVARPAVDPTFEARLANLEQSTRDLTSGVAALGQRLAPLESSSAAIGATAKSAKANSDAAQADAAKALAAANKAADLAQQATTAAPAAGAAAPDLGPVNARLDKLESAVAALDKSAADPVALADRIAKLEAALAAPKSEARAAPEVAGPAKVEWAAIAVAAEAIAGRLVAGEPYAPEQAALVKLGADPAKLAALAAFAEKGAPTGRALAADFDKIAPDVLKAAAPKAEGGMIDRLMANMSKIVKITPVGETIGDDPAAIVSRIVGALNRGDIAAAATSWAQLPEPARQVSQSWASALQARLAAETAARGLLNDAMAALAKGDKS